MTPIFADAGVPMLFLEAPAMLFAIVPVIFLEAYVLSRSLQLQFWPSSRVSAVANLASSLVGMPLAWGLMLLLEFVATSGGTAYGLETAPKKILAVTVQAAWLVPYEDDLYWMVPAAATVLLIPTFFISVLIEWGIARVMLREQVKQPVRPAVWRANLVSYGFLLILCLIWLLCSLFTKHSL